MRLEHFHFELGGAQLTEKVLDKFQNEIGGAIDSTYRQFLLARNGGVPEPALVSSNPGLGYEIRVFFKLAEGFAGLRRAYFDLAEELGKSKPDVRGLLPVAADCGDRFICIVVGSERSAVFVVPIGSCGDSGPLAAIMKVADDFSAFVQSLTQPDEVVSDIESLAQKTWQEVCGYIAAGGDMNARSPSGLSLLCQSIRYENSDIFNGLLAAGADLGGALEIAVTNRRLDLVKELVAKGCSPAEGLRFAVGPKRKEIREFLEAERRKRGRS